MRYTTRETFGVNDEYDTVRYGVWDTQSNCFVESPTGVGRMVFLSESYAEETCDELNSAMI